MKISIFIRILLATLLPLILVFMLVISTISNIIYASGAESSRQAINKEAKQLAMQLSDRLDNASSFLNAISLSLSDIDYKNEKSKAKGIEFLSRMLSSNPSYLSAWFAFNLNAEQDEGFIYEVILQGSSTIKNIRSISPYIEDIDSNFEYSKAFLTGKPQISMNTRYEMGLGESKVNVVTMTNPIFSKSIPIGASGLDMRYSDLFSADEESYSLNSEMLLIFESGEIILSKNSQLEGHNIYDFPFEELDQLKKSMADKSSFMGELYSPISEDKSLVCLYPINLNNTDQYIYLYLSMPVQDVYALAKSSMELIISTSIIGLILLSFSVFFATRSIVRPIKQLTVDFDRVSQGDRIELSSEVNSKGRSSNVVEIDILQSALWKMLKQINLTHELRLKATEEKVEKERILAASEAKSKFLASVSHEIRTPMNAITGISEILLNKENLSPKQRKYINDIKFSSDALLGLINDILDIAKLESGKLNLEERDYNFHLALDNIKNIGNYLAAPNMLEFCYITKGDLPLCLYGDEVRLRQILLNLLSNACKFTLKGSVTLTVSSDEESLHFSVADTGIGISEEDLKSIFDPFKRFDSRGEKIQGTGLGLSICNSLVQMMGDNLLVSSELDKGSVFSFKIAKKCGDINSIKMKDKAERGEYMPGVKVLIVDDNEINLSVAEGLLGELYGLDCDLAISGEKALSMVQNNKYDLIFMDYMMPGMDGIETTKHLRQMGGVFETLPIIALTANAVKGAKEKMLGSGIDDYLTKPIEVDDLNNILFKWIPEEYRVKKDC